MDLHQTKDLTENAWKWSDMETKTAKNKCTLLQHVLYIELKIVH
jgi:hypothetical protein